MANFIAKLLHCLQQIFIFMIKHVAYSISAMVIVSIVLSGKVLASSDLNSPAAKDSTNSPSNAEVSYKNGTYYPKARITVTPSSNPIQGRGTIIINGTAELVSTTNSQDIQAKSDADGTLTVRMDSDGNITVPGVPPAPLTNSGGASPDILDNTVSITVTGDGSKHVVINVTVDVTGVGALGAVKTRIGKSITLASRPGQPPGTFSVSIHHIQQ